MYAPISGAGNRESEMSLVSFLRIFKPKSALGNAPYHYHVGETFTPGTGNLAFNTGMTTPPQSSGGDRYRAQLSPVSPGAMTIRAQAIYAGIPQVTADIKLQGVTTDPLQNMGS